MTTKLWPFLLVVSLLMGCSGKLHYPNTAEKNLTATTHLELTRFAMRTGLFSKIEAFLGVHEVDSNCEVEYLGFVPLSQGDTEIGIPADRLMLLVVEVNISSLRGNSGTTHRKTLIRPQAGHNYQLKTSYVNGMFDLQLYETGSSAGPRALPLIPLSGCSKSM